MTVPIPFPPMPVVLFRGGGDLASGAACRLFRCGFAVAILELAHPLVIRRHVAFANAVFEGEWTVEGVRAVRVSRLPALPWPDWIPVIVDPAGDSMRALHPSVVVDARMLKTAADTRREDAPLVVGLGPGFTVGRNCHRAVETMRGHFLGRVYCEGSPLADTGIPGDVGGKTVQRVLRSPADGIFQAEVGLGAQVCKDQVVGRVASHAVLAATDGLVRGLILDGTQVWTGLKVADVDPRPAAAVDLYSVSDKARAIGGAVLEAILGFWRDEGLGG